MDLKTEALFLFSENRAFLYGLCRIPLYPKHADVVVECVRLTHEGVSAKIVQELRKKGTDSFQEREKRRS